jgi:hypothetical protein
MHTPTRGRRRVLDPQKKADLCELVARGFTVDEAAGCVGVSVRTVQRELMRDEAFSRQVLAAQRTPPDPARIMQSAARAHWRATAWLLERTDPERFGRRPPNSATPEQVQRALANLVAAAVEVIPPQHRPGMYQRLEAAAVDAFFRLFPNYKRPQRMSEPSPRGRATPQDALLSLPSGINPWSVPQ